MDAGTFDAMARAVATKLSRRRLAAAAAAAATAAAAPPGLRRVRALSAASALVQHFYELVDAYQYADAYALLGAAWQAQQSLANFTAGYADTAFVQCTLTGEQPVGGGTSVAVQLIAWHNDGTIHGYAGHYTVGTESGQLRLLAGNNQAAPVPPGTPPLCTIAALAFGFGAWTAGLGNRFSAVVATHAGGAPCVVGGSPRVTLSDALGHAVRSTSVAGSPPLGIVLHAGGVAHAPLRFLNWCEGAHPPFAAAVEVPGDSHHGAVATGAGISLPPCLAPGQPATMDITAWLAGAA
jgi:hypothetical protein